MTHVPPQAHTSALRLYHHPVSTTSRPIVMFAAEHGVPLDLRVIDLFAGEQFGSAYSAINPNQAVPVLEHGRFRLTESSAILKYLAEHIGSPAYPAETQQRAQVNEAMDWFNTGLSRELLYGVAYPQVCWTGGNRARPGQRPRSVREARRRASCGRRGQHSPCLPQPLTLGAHFAASTAS